jgi:hypothetical protein
VALVHDGRLLLSGEPQLLLSEFARTHPDAKSPNFETVFLASLEQAERQKAQTS